MVFHLVPILSVLFYVSASVVYAIRLFSKKETTFTLPRLLLVIGLFAQIVFLALWGLGEAPILINFPLALSLISCLIILVFLLLEKKKSISSLGAFVSPIAVCSMIYSGAVFHLNWFGVGTDATQLVWLHIGATLLGYVALSLAFAVSVALVVKESLLKRRLFTGIQQKLPPIITLDLINAGMIWMGFVLLAIGVVLGLAVGTDSADIALRVIWPCATLFVYGLVLFARVYRGIRGRRVALLSIAGFVLVILSVVTGTLSGGGFHVH